jgi:hypothetical protein
MDTFKIRYIFIVAMLVSACASMSLNNRLDIAYKSVTAYSNQAYSLLSRGRITVAQAEKASNNSKRAKEALDFASGLTKACPAEPCTTDGQLKEAEAILDALEVELKDKE